MDKKIINVCGWLVLIFPDSLNLKLVFTCSLTLAVSSDRLISFNKSSAIIILSNWE